MEDSNDWCTSRYAVVTLCLKKLVEDPVIPITNDLKSIFWYSCICFRESSFDFTLQRTIDMVLAYKEFYKMTNNLENHNAFQDVFMFIVKSFPSSVMSEFASGSIVKSKDTIILLNMIHKLVDKTISNLELYRKYNISFTDDARKIFFDEEFTSSQEQTSLSDETLVTNG
jgi:hypothetical protein